MVLMLHRPLWANVFILGILLRDVSQSFGAAASKLESGGVQQVGLFLRGISIRPSVRLARAYPARCFVVRLEVKAGSWSPLVDPALALPSRPGWPSRGTAGTEELPAQLVPSEGELPPPRGRSLPQIHCHWAPATQPEMRDLLQSIEKETLHGRGAPRASRSHRSCLPLGKQAAG